MSDDADATFNAGSGGDERGFENAINAKESAGASPVPEQNGFVRGVVPEKIIDARKSLGGEIMFLVKWKDMDVTSLVPSQQAREECPQMVIDFYESYCTFRTEGTELAGAGWDFANQSGNETAEQDSNQGVSEGGETTDGGKDPLLILPKEMWVKLLENHVTNPKDRWSLINTCQLFDNILFEWKVMMMALEQALPYVYFKLSRAQLLDCRLVSKGWKATVDHFLEDHPSQRPFTSARNEPCRLDFIYPSAEKRLGDRETGQFLIARSNNHSFTSIDDPFFESMKQGAANPFLGRNVILCLETREGGEKSVVEAMDEWWAKLLKFLEIFGKEIWYLELLMSRLPRVQDKLAELFPLLPNLRKLLLRFVVDADSRFTDNALAIIPLASTLETLEVRFGSRGLFAPNPSTLLFQRYHQQLGKIHLQMTEWKLVSHLVWPKLSELSVLISDPKTYKRPVRSSPSEFACAYFSHLRGTGGRMPLLEKLAIRFCHDLQVKALEYKKGFLRTLFQVVNDLTATTKLRTLQVGGIQIFADRMGWEGLETLSQINTLLLELPRPLHQPSLDFLSHCFPTVKNIHIFIAALGYEEGLGVLESEDEDVEVSRFRDRRIARITDENNDLLRRIFERRSLYDSNIWERLPDLKVLTFQRRVYDKLGYDRYRTWQEKCNKESKLRMREDM